MSKKKLSEFESWEGVDVDTATSLFEYGILFNPNAKENECSIIYGVGVDAEGNYNRFAFASVDWNDLIASSWIDWDAVCRFCGCEKSAFDTFSVGVLHDLIGYYGAEEVLGSCYHEGFEVEE